jgi:hypothetical protein
VRGIALIAKGLRRLEELLAGELVDSAGLALWDTRIGFWM